MKVKINSKTEFAENYTERFNNLKNKLLEMTEMTETTDVKFAGYKIFVSVGYKPCRACVFAGIGDTFETAYKTACDKARKYIKTVRANPDWLKVDLVVKEYILTVDEFIELAQKIKKYYFKYGIAFDSMYHFAFLAQEVNAAALIKYDETDSYSIGKNVKNSKNDKIDELVGLSREDLPLRNKCQLNFYNINLHLKQTRNQNVDTNEFKIQQLIIFDTISVFSGNPENRDEFFESSESYESEIDDIFEFEFEMETRELYKDRRKINEITPQVITGIISKSADYLIRTIHNSGKFIYGYFPAFNREIASYNSIRHALGVLGIADAYLTLKDRKDRNDKNDKNNKNDYLLNPLRKALEYLTTELIYYSGENAYIVDYVNNNEIRLGALAVSVLAITKCMEIFGETAAAEEKAAAFEAKFEGLGLNEDDMTEEQGAKFMELTLKMMFAGMGY